MTSSGIVRQSSGWVLMLLLLSLVYLWPSSHVVTWCAQSMITDGSSMANQTQQLAIALTIEHPGLIIEPVAQRSDGQPGQCPSDSVVLEGRYQAGFLAVDAAFKSPALLAASQWGLHAYGHSVSRSLGWGHLLMVVLMVVLIVAVAGVTFRSLVATWRRHQAASALN